MYPESACPRARWEPRQPFDSHSAMPRAKSSSDRRGWSQYMNTRATETGTSKPWFSWVQLSPPRRASSAYARTFCRGSPHIMASQARIPRMYRSSRPRPGRRSASRASARERPDESGSSVRNALQLKWSACSRSRTLGWAVRCASSAATLAASAIRSVWASAWVSRYTIGARSSGSISGSASASRRWATVAVGLMRKVAEASSWSSTARSSGSGGSCRARVSRRRAASGAPECSASRAASRRQATASALPSQGTSSRCRAAAAGPSPAARTASAAALCIPSRRLVPMDR